MAKKLLFSILFFGIIFGGFKIATAQNAPGLELNFFYSKTCLYCAAEQKFLDEIEKKYSELKINRYPTDDSRNQKLLVELAKKYKAERYLGLVPLTFVGEDFFAGFDKAEGIGKKIEDSIQRQLAQLPPLPDSNQDKENIRLPFAGEINLKRYSLPVLSVVLGFLDGFNVCSLGALVLILGLALTLRSRKKIIIFGGIFILTTAVIYALLILLWYKFFSLLAPYVRIMEILIGAIGIGGGVYFLKQFIKFKKYGPACKIKNGQVITSRFSSKIQNSFKNTNNFLALAGLVLLFAAVITIVEFPCSAVVPVIFAGFLSKAQLPFLAYLFYIVLYIIFYMLDEIIVFLVAAFKMTVWLSSGKFVTWITLIEAIVLFFLGFYYLIGLV